MKIAIASDHAGFSLKATLIAALAAHGYEYLDLGVYNETSVDYPDYAHALANILLIEQADLGVLVCGTGIGISMVANRYPHIRAAVCNDVTSARLAREHNNANVLCMGARLIGTEVAKDCLFQFLTTAFAGGRHQERLDKFTIPE